MIARARNLPAPTTKGEAKSWADKLRHEIRTATFVDPDAQSEPVAAAAARLTFGDVVKLYREQYVEVPTRRDTAVAMFNVHLNMLLRATVPAAHGTTIPLSDKPIDTITKADIESIRTARRSALAAAQTARVAAAEARGRETARPPPRAQR